MRESHDQLAWTKQNLICTYIQFNPMEALPLVYKD